MTREAIVDIFDRRQRMWQRRDPAGLGAFHSDSGIVHSPIFGTVQGRVAITASYVDLFKKFGDWTLEGTRLLIDGRAAAQSFTVQATHTSDLFGTPATGRRCELHGVLFMDLDEAGLITGEVRFYDFTSMLLQLGVLKMKPGS
jgi:steroid delta-isomerase-like uncharacterized protein